MKSYEDYKDSGIEWIGKIPTHWQVKKIKYIGESIIGITYSPEDIVDQESMGTLVLRASNIQKGKLSLNDNVYIQKKIADKHRLKYGDILICSRNGSKALIGKNICIDDRTVGNTFGAFMTLIRTKNWKFMSKFFNSPIFNSQSELFSTSTINQLTINIFNNMFVAIPTIIEEQTQIASYLDYKTTLIDKLIEKNEKLIELLEEKCSAMINQSITKGLDPNVKMKDSGIEWIGEIPEHWEVNKLKFNDVVIMGQSPNSSDYNTENIGLPFLQGNADFSNINPIPRINCNTVNKIAEKNDILISVRAPVGAVNIADQSYGIGRGLSAIRANHSYYKYLYYLSLVMKSELKSLSTGSTFEAISVDEIKNIHTPKPSHEEQLLITHYLDYKTSLIDKLTEQKRKINEFLKEYRTNLISNVVTGKIDVRDEKIPESFTKK